jgi:lipid-binding SYLF domain-containing protein
MRKASVLVVAMFLACPTFAANESREQKRLEACGQVFKEIMDIPDGIPKDLLNQAECVIVIPSVLKFAIGIGGVRPLLKTRVLLWLARARQNDTSITRNAVAL